MIVGAKYRWTVSVVVVAVLAGAPAVHAACATVCAPSAPAVAHATHVATGHEGHLPAHAGPAATTESPDAAPAAAPTGHEHHGPTAGGPTVPESVAPEHACCGTTAGVSLVPATPRAEAGAPPVALPMFGGADGPSRIATPRPGEGRSGIAPPAPVRARLVLRI